MQDIPRHSGVHHHSSMLIFITLFVIICVNDLTQLATQYSTSSAVKALLDTTTIHFVPIGT